MTVKEVETLKRIEETISTCSMLTRVELLIISEALALLADHRLIQVDDAKRIVQRELSK